MRCLRGRGVERVQAFDGHAIVEFIHNGVGMTVMATARRPLQSNAVLLAAAIFFGGGCGQRTAERPWAPADARMEPLADLHKPGTVEIAFWVSTVPEELALAIRQHYAQERWRERTAPEAFKWHEWAGGGVIRVPGQPNPITIGWCGEWVNEAGDIVFYALQVESDKPSERAEVHTYASLREHDQYFEQCEPR